MFESIQPVKGIRDVFKYPNDSAKAKAIFAVAQEVLREPSVLSSADRELIAAFTSSLNKCEFCTGSHIVFAIEQGTDAEEIKRVTSGDYADHRLAPLFDYVSVLTRTPSEISQDDYNKVIMNGFTEEELHDAILVCAAFNMYNRIVEGHKVERNEDTWDQSAKVISSIGYDGRYM
jgi:uncharacterized peroxidase-related enzyme